MIAPAPAPALALVLAAAPSLLPPPQARLLPPWYGAVDCYTSALSADDLALVRRYIALNKQAILDHWHELTDGSELVRVPKRLP